MNPIKAWLSVRAAQAVTHAWLEQERQLCDTANGTHNWSFWYRIPRGMHQQSCSITGDDLHSIAISFHLQLPKVVIGIWFLLSLIGICKNIESYTGSRLYLGITAFTIQGIISMVFYILFSGEIRKIMKAESKLEEQIKKKFEHNA